MGRNWWSLWVQIHSKLFNSGRVWEAHFCTPGTRNTHSHSHTHPSYSHQCWDKEGRASSFTLSALRLIMAPQVRERPLRLQLMPSSLCTMILNLLVPALILGTCHLDLHLGFISKDVFRSLMVYSGRISCFLGLLHVSQKCPLFSLSGAAGGQRAFQSQQTNCCCCESLQHVLDVMLI